MRTVLIVDDEKLFLASLAEGLSDYADSFTVVTAKNGAEAVEVLAARSVDLVVTDLKMPVMDGFQLIAYMMASHPLIPVIVMTAFGTPNIEDQLSEYSPFGYLEKPIDFQVLADRIQAGLAQIARGHIQGITLFAFLQLLELEKKTCSLSIKSHGQEGLLYFAEGELIDAAYDELVGVEAARKIVCWEQVDIEMVSVVKKMTKRIDTPLPNLLMEAAQMMDEENRDSSDDEAPVKEDQHPQIQSLDGDSSLSAKDAADVKAAKEDSSFRDVEEPPTHAAPGKELAMASNVNESLIALMALDGAVAAALVDINSGMTLGTAGNSVDMEVAAAGNSDVIKAKRKAMQSLGLQDKIEDVLISLSAQYHLIRPLSSSPDLFLYFVLNRATSNLALARHKLSDIESRLEV